MTAGTVEVLLVDDDMGDVELTRASLKECKIPVRLNHVQDGCQCLDYLHRRGDFEKAAPPDLILLDLNMPKMDGREALTEIRKTDAFRKIPVVVLTTSDAGTDIKKMYELGANCYVTKPVDFEQFRKVVNALAEFWFSVVKLPPKG